MIHGLAHFPGLNQIVEGQFSFAVGVTPSTAYLTIAPQENLTASVGTLKFFDGQVELEWPDCRIDTNSFTFNRSGQIWRLAILDRRWKWQSRGGGGVISRGANLKSDDKKFILGTDMNLQELAEKCLEAMGEDNYDVSALSTDEAPEIFWDAALPAQCLDELCQQFGFRVVLSPVNNRVKICKVGEGAELPISNDIRSNSLSLNIPTVPEKIHIVCKPTKFQVDVDLEAVGIENDGKNSTLKLIDDLSYKPAGGWGKVDLDHFYSVDKGVARALAKKSLFKYYRVKFPFDVPGYFDQNNNQGSVSYPWQIQVLDGQVEWVKEDWNLPVEHRRNKPAQIGGKYWCENDPGKDADHNITRQDVAPYQIDPMFSQDDEEIPELLDRNWSFGNQPQLGSGVNHYVVFQDPIYRKTVSDPIFGPNTYDTYAPATLVLRTAFLILDNQLNAPVRNYFTLDTGSGSGTERYEVRSDLQVTYFYDYVRHQLWSNEEEMRKEARYYAEGIRRDYQDTKPQTITYLGLKSIDLDGAIQQVTYTVHKKSGCRTIASRNTEELNVIQPLSYRRLMCRLKHSVAKEERRDERLQEFRRGGGR